MAGEPVGKKVLIESHQIRHIDIFTDKHKFITKKNYKTNQQEQFLSNVLLIQLI